MKLLRKWNKMMGRQSSRVVRRKFKYMYVPKKKPRKLRKVKMKPKKK